MGKRELEVEIQEKTFITLQTQLDEIASFEGKKFLEESLLNLDAKRRESEVRITMVENQKLDSKNLEVKLQKIDLTCGKLEAQIKNYDDQLIHKITAKDDIRES